MTCMKYGPLPGIAKPVSRIFFGTAVDPMKAGENCDDLLDGVLATGVNAFDTARVYGLAEKSLGDWMERRRNRDRLVVLTKGGHPEVSDMSSRITREEIREDLFTSLEYLKTDHVDIYMLHRDDTSVPVAEIMDIMNEFVREGSVRALGTSNWSLPRILEANALASSKGLAPYICASPYFGLADEAEDPWGGNCTSISGPANASDRKWFEESRMPVIAYSGLAHGFLSGKLTSANWDRMDEVLDSFAIRGYRSEENRERLRRIEKMAAEKGESVPRLALAWLLCQNVNVFPVVSTTKVSRMEENAGALDIALTPAECEWLNLESD